VWLAQSDTGELPAITRSSTVWADRLDEMDILRRTALIDSKADNHMLRGQIASWEISR